MTIESCERHIQNILFALEVGALKKLPVDEFTMRMLEEWIAKRNELLLAKNA